MKQFKRVLWTCTIQTCSSWRCLTSFCVNPGRSDSEHPMFTMFTMRRGIARMKMGSCVLLTHSYVLELTSIQNQSSETPSYSLTPTLLILHRDMTLPVSNAFQSHTMTATSCYLLDLLCLTIQMTLCAPVWMDPRRLNNRLSKAHTLPVQPLYYSRQLLSNVLNGTWNTSSRASATVLMY